MPVRRVFAVLFDWLVFLPLVVSLGGISPTLAEGIVVSACFWVYKSTFEALLGFTLGKRVFGLKVDFGAQALPFSQRFLRSGLRGLPHALSLVSVDISWQGYWVQVGIALFVVELLDIGYLVTHPVSSLHDRLAGTSVQPCPSVLANILGR